MHGNRKTHILMIILMLIRTFDTVSISKAVREVPQITLLCLKYISALPVVYLVNRIRRPFSMPERKDMKKLFLSALTGFIIYYIVEYTAIKHMPVSISTVLIGILPAVSYVTDCMVRKRKIRKTLLGVILLSLGGLAMVVQSHKETGGGDWLGVICCFACVFIWVAYGYSLRSLEDDCSSDQITLYQMLISIPLLLPYTLMHLPAGLNVNDILFYIVLPGMLSGGLGDLIEVKGLIDLGTTVTGVYLNLLPVFTAAAGVIFLHETMTVPQIIGSLTVIVCGIYINTRSDV